MQCGLDFSVVMEAPGWLWSMSGWGRFSGNNKAGPATIDTQLERDLYLVGSSRTYLV
jgi:hypothetical protein